MRIESLKLASICNIFIYIYYFHFEINSLKNITFK